MTDDQDEGTPPRPPSALDPAVLASASLAGSSLAAEIRAARAGQGLFRDVGVLAEPLDPAALGFRLVPPPLDTQPAFDAAGVVEIVARAGQGHSLASVPGPAPSRSQRPRNHQAIGTQTTLVDALTGEILGTSLLGATARPER